MDARLRDVNTPIDGVMTDVLRPPPVLMGCSNGECQFQVFAGCNCPSVALKGMYEIRKGDALPRTPLSRNGTAPSGIAAQLGRRLGCNTRHHLRIRVVLFLEEEKARPFLF